MRATGRLQPESQKLTKKPLLPRLRELTKLHEQLFHREFSVRGSDSCLVAEQKKNPLR